MASKYPNGSWGTLETRQTKLGCRWGAARAAACPLRCCQSPHCRKPSCASCCAERVRHRGKGSLESESLANLPFSLTQTSCLVCKGDDKRVAR